MYKVLKLVSVDIHLLTSTEVASCNEFELLLSQAGELISKLLFATTILQRDAVRSCDAQLGSQN